MQRLEHMQHLDKHLVDELAQVARESVRDELREQARGQRRKAALYGASGAVALYAGAAVALAVGLALALVLPGWAAALITAVILGAVAYALRNAARPSPAPGRGAAGQASVPGQRDAGRGRAGGVAVPPVPSTPPATGVVPPRPDTPAPGAPGSRG
ncbi:phage holin family protein [Streptomyces prasinopilosus]|uniref:Putative Holin-X, holin superfamily III n=1 Tax=Streptomyces prasinopilosus TaxID=67344 RepID=A0A1G6MAL0_9ACTN|nr:phage holin family protein [Streptomyces prasinopilosus]SDC52529.1 Putative Holin-X, holin superfamily III [Streptomyces prasinopilosus]